MPLLENKLFSKSSVYSLVGRLQVVPRFAFLLFLLSLLLFMAASVGSVLSRMSNLRVVYVTAPSKDVALKIARAAVESKVAACVNIIPSVTSIYEWEGKLHEDSEVVMIFKTQEQRVEELHKVVMANHTYDVPAFVSIAADAVSSPYAQWVIDQTK